jgi:putative phage-type endonuclease
VSTPGEPAVTAGRKVSATAVQIAPVGLDVTDRPRWLALRREGIGGSDAAAVLGLDKSPAGKVRRTRWQVWLDKTGAYDGDGDWTDEQREWLEWGHEQEAVIARIWARRAGVRPGAVRRIGMLMHAQHPWMRVNLDRMVTRCPDGDGPCLLECKNRSPFQQGEWGSDSDAVPDAPAIQVQHGLAVTGWTHGHLLAGFGNHLRAYRIDADPELIAMLTAEEGAFWRDYVLTGAAPPVDASERTGQILARLWDADPDKVAEATAQQQALVRRLREAQLAEAAAAEDVALLRHQVQEQMAEAEVLLDPGSGQPLVTWVRNGTFASARFRQDHPDLAQSCTRQAQVLDPGLLASRDPRLYRQYRGRRFVIKPPPANGEEHHDG